MRWIGLLGILTSCLAGILISGCSSKTPPAPERHVDQHAQQEDNRPGDSDQGGRPRPLAVVAGPSETAAEDGVIKAVDLLLDKAPEATREEKYTAALLQALDQVADRKFDDALTSLKTAQAMQDTEQIRQEIVRIQGMIDKQAAAEQTVKAVQSVLTDGKPEEASQLATTALQQFGETGLAGQLIQLNQQANALSATQLDSNAQRDRFRQEGEAALRDRNLRAAAVAFDQALQTGDDPDLQREAEEVHATLTRYDDDLRRAADLRHDPSNLEEAIAALQDAQKTWDTVEIRQEIDQYALALQNRRDRVGVTDFEVRGDVGLPYAGRTVAEELLPAFRPRFDMVERGQLGKVIDELKLDAGDLAANQNGYRELGRLAKMRYLVLGSVSSFDGITVNARLVEVRSGLIVQTAKLVAASPDDLIRRLPQLAHELMMTDEQKLAYEQDLAARTTPPPPVQWVNASLPPPPEQLPASEPPPAPVIAFSVRAPAWGNLVAADIVRSFPDNQPENVVVVESESPYQQRLLHVAVELGDNLFRRGRYQEAHAQFELALTLSPEREDLRIRVDRCRPLLPPPPPAVVTPPPVVVLSPQPQPLAPITVVPVALSGRPRIAVLNFMVDADPDRAPPGFGDWVAEQMASYFAPTYDVVDRGKLFWYMGRLGLTVADVFNNPNARRCLGRALNVRFFVFGAVQQTASFNVTTNLMDAESGAKQQGGMIHVKDQQELKLRLGELAGQTSKTQADPAQAVRLQEEAKANEQRVVTARGLLQAGHYQDAVRLCQEGLKANPNNVALQALLDQGQQKARDAAVAEARKREFEQAQTQAEESRRRQQELAKQAEAARVRAAQEAAIQGQAAKQAQEAQRQHAHDQLVAQARLALQQGNYQRSTQLLESALGLKPNDASDQKVLAEVRAKATEADRVRAEQEKARLDAESKNRQAAAVALARAKVDEEHTRLAAEEQKHRQAQEERDQATYTKRLEDGKRLLSEQKYSEAVVTLQSAQELKKTPEVQRLLAGALEKKAMAEAQKKGADSQAQLQRKLTMEKAAREQADAEAKRKQDLYSRALQDAQKAQAEKRFDLALAKYQEAGAIFRTDVVLNGIHQVQQARDVPTNPPPVKPVIPPVKPMVPKIEDQRHAEFARLMGQGKAALAAKHFDEAIGAFEAAIKLDPRDVTAAQALKDAQKAKVASAIPMAPLKPTVILPPPKKPENPPPPVPPSPPVKPAGPTAEEQHRANFLSFMGKGKAALTAKRYEDAIIAYDQAIKLEPFDGAASQGLKEAQQALAASKAQGVPQGSKPTLPASPVNPTIAPLPPKAMVTTVSPPPTLPAAHLPPLEYTKQMQAGADFEKLQKYSEAILAYQQALKVSPGDSRATTSLNHVQYLQHMVDGRNKLASKKFAEAAKDFEEALKRVPNDPEATNALRRAREGKP